MVKIEKFINTNVFLRHTMTDKNDIFKTGYEIKNTYAFDLIKKDLKKEYGLDSLVKEEMEYNKSKYDTININDKNTDNYTTKPNYITNINSARPASPAPRINWGTNERQASENAYVQPTPEEVKKVLEAIHLIQQLTEEQQRQLIETTRELRYFFDGNIRARFGATNHFNAIRCLNDPQRTAVSDALSRPRAQMAGEEFFALNRFMADFPDIADIQWWAVYENGSWRLDTWNPEGEHLDTGFDGWGQLVGSVMKVNGRVLNPSEMIAFYRTVKLRDERGFMTAQSLQSLQAMLSAVEREGSLPKRYEEQLEAAHDLGLVDASGKALTYAGKSMITQVKARQRKERQLAETDPEIRRIIVPTFFN